MLEVILLQSRQQEAEGSYNYTLLPRDMTSDGTDCMEWATITLHSLLCLKACGHTY